MSALVSARDWRLRSMAICVSSLEDRTCSTATRVFKRTSEVRAVIQRTCELALFVSSLATCYPLFIFLAASEADTRTNCQSVGVQGQKIGNPNQSSEATTGLTMLPRVSSGCCEALSESNFALVSAPGRLLRRRGVSRPTERLNAAQRHHAPEAEASKRAASRVGVLFSTISGISPDDAAVSILTTIAH